MAFQELPDGSKSIQKAEYISHTLGKRGKEDYIEVVYKRLDGNAPGAEAKAGAFVSVLSQESKDRIKAKGQFVVVKTKTGKFWNLTEINDVSTFAEKPVSTYTKNTNSGYTKSSGGSSSYNTAGIKVGAVLHDAAALVGVGGTIAQVKTVAEQLLSLSYELEANVNAGKYEPKAKTETPKALKGIEEDFSDEDLSSIEF